MTRPFIRVGGWDDFAAYILKHFPPPERKERDMPTNLIESTNVAVLTRIAHLEDKLAEERKLLEQRPPEPSGTGTVVRFRKYGQSYSYAAIRIGTGMVTGSGVWYVTQDGSRTSKQGIPPKSWDALLDWIGDRNFGTIEILS